MGLWGTVAGCALVLGPLAGGPLTDAFGRPAIFLVNVPIGLVAVVTGRRGITESRDPGHGAPDLTGQLLGALWIGLLTFAVIEAGRLGPSPDVLVTGALGLAALVAFVVVELRVEHPMLPVRLFARPRFSVAIFAAWSLGFGTYPAVFLIGVYLQQARGATATEAGVQMLPYVLANVAAGRLSARFGAERLVAIAFALAGAGVGLSVTPSNIVGLVGPPQRDPVRDGQRRPPDRHRARRGRARCAAGPRFDAVERAAPGHGRGRRRPARGDRAHRGDPGPGPAAGRGLSCQPWKPCLRPSWCWRASRSRGSPSTSSTGCTRTSADP
ncbi:Major Facilitator Superfamily protein [Amycolatopsis pretoriensis]|uniref:Major Facilitator Superfamily protein n=1 Tax=Amycolatopsis pretoriensis TaxID=218821 RepID=A0A1H5QS81_9PSEU|nr:MFS transporter [Amycolatopsis pretoriensis]SEF28899.1 Major Facilitator Superfamily protein [Amycolatopsis pretoriensis]